MEKYMKLNSIRKLLWTTCKHKFDKVHRPCSTSGLSASSMQTKTVNENYASFPHHQDDTTFHLVDLSSAPVKPAFRSSSQNQILVRRHVTQAKKERKAFKALIHRSGLTPHSFLQNHFNSVACRYFSSTNQNQQNEKDRDHEGKEKDGNEKPPWSALLVYSLLTLGTWLIILRALSSSNSELEQAHYLSWNEFLHEMLAKGEVEEMIIHRELGYAIIKTYPNAVIKGRKLPHNLFHMMISDSNKFEQKLRKAEEELGIPPGQGVPVSYKNASIFGRFAVQAIILLIVFLVLRNLFKVSIPNASEMFMSERKAKFVRVDLQTQQGKGVTFKDVAGLKEAKIEVMEFVDYLKAPARFKELGARIPHGALMLGPPGCGKTLLAKAVASEAKVPFLAMAGSEFVEMLGGLGAARVRDLFKEARNNAPCIVYVDEIDAIGKKRSGQNMTGTGEEEHTLNQLLTEMDGMSKNDGVIMLASTNRADVLDNALLRPGRFDRHITIDLPTLIERKEIFEMYLKSLVLVKTPDAYADRLAQMSPGMSGADIANICNEAALFAARSGKKAIDTDDFEYAVERVVAGVAKKSRVLSVAEKKVISYHEAGHALMGWLLKHTDVLLQVSIIPRTNNVLGFAQYMPSDRKLHSTEQIFEIMCMALGGRVAESLTFNRVTTGAEDDLKKVTRMAYDQIRVMGMNENVGNISFGRDADNFGSKPYSKKLAKIIDIEAQQLIAKAYQHTEKILKENKDKLQLVAESLLEKESLKYDDMVMLIGPPPHGKKQIINEDVDSSQGTSPPTPAKPITNYSYMKFIHSDYKEKLS